MLSSAAKAFIDSRVDLRVRVQDDRLFDAGRLADAIRAEMPPELRDEADRRTVIDRVVATAVARARSGAALHW